MKKNLLIYLYGAIIIMSGIFLLFEKYFTFNSTRDTLGIAFIIGAVLILIKFSIGQWKQIQFAYHEMHALVMFVYGISVLLLANTIERLIYLTAFLLFFYAFSEIIFCSWLFNLQNKIKFKILLIRVFLGLLVGIGTVMLMTNYSSNKVFVMEGFGILFTLIGLNILLYVPIMNPKIISKNE